MPRASSGSGSLTAARPFRTRPDPPPNPPSHGTCDLPRRSRPNPQHRRIEMGISLRPEHVKRYRDIAKLLFRYGRSDLVKSAGLDDALLPEDSIAEAAGPRPEELADDL